MVETNPSLSFRRRVDSDISLAFRKVFSVLEPEEEAFLLRSSTQHLYDAGEVIIEQGANFSGIYVIVNGEAKVNIRNADMPSDVIEVARLGRGDIFGEMSFVDSLPTSASVVADDAMEILVIDDDVIKSLFFADATFGRRFYHSIAITLAKRLRETNPKVLVSPGTKQN